MNPDLIEVVSLADTLAAHARLGVQVTSLKQCNSQFYSQLFTTLAGSQVTQTVSSESSRCQAVVDALSNHLSPHVSLEHIKGADLATQDLLTVKNLLDIFSVLYCLPPEHSHEDQANDSNLLSTEGLSVISEVLREELGPAPPHTHAHHPPHTRAHHPPHTCAHHSHSTTDTDSTTELLRPVPPAQLPASLTAHVTTATITNQQPPDISVSSQTTPTQSPERHRRVLQSPLHHSTPHASTCSRILNLPTTPHALSFAPTPHQNHKSDPPPHTLHSHTPADDVSISVMPDSTHSTTVPDLTITDLHTTCETTIPDPHTPVNHARPSRVRFTTSTEQRACLTADRPTLTASQPHTQQPSSVDQQSHSSSESRATPPGHHCIERLSPLPTQDHVPEEPHSPTDHSADESTGEQPPGVSDKSRADVLATLYRNYVTELRKGHGVKSRDKGRAKVTTTTRKHKPAKYPRPRRRTTPPQESSDEDKSASPPTKFAVGDDLLPLVERDFPFLHVSPSTMRRLWQQQVQQVRALTSAGERRGSSACVRVREMERRHQALLSVIRKEIQHTQRMQRSLEQRSQKQAVLSSVRTKRQTAARARRYFHDYELRLKAKLQRRRTREEQIFKRAFEDGLELQRERVREMRRYARERQEASSRDHQEKLEAMENFYRDQFAMLTESMLTERANMAVREKAQKKVVGAMRRELREKMESEIKDLQDTLDREEDVVHFRELDELELRHKLANLTFTSTLH